MRRHFKPIIGSTGLVFFLLLGPNVRAAEGAATEVRVLTDATVVTILPPTNHGVTVLRRGAVAADPAQVGQGLHDGDTLETGAHSTVLLRFSERETLTVLPQSKILVGTESRLKRGFKALRGLLRFFHRDKPDDFEADTPTTGALILGTEFELEVAGNGATTLRLFDGRVEMRNEFGRLHLTNGEVAVAEPGQAPSRTAVIRAMNLVQWNLYYPGVLDMAELQFSEEEREALRASLAAYATGDLLGAAANYPPQRQPASDEERIYRAALLLSVGRAEEAQAYLNALSKDADVEGRRAMLVEALRDVIAAITLKASRAPLRETRSTNSATALVAESYVQQSRSQLELARAAAQQATAISPRFSYAWSRLAELEFSFGRIRAAEKAVGRSLELAPRNAEAIALKGFLLAANKRFTDAMASFDRAIALDGALANAWLGRGLCRIHKGRAAEGRNDLQMAATLEPQRAVLRSYLGKAFGKIGDDEHAAREIELAKVLDPSDPTGWLYSALLNRQERRLNEAVRDLERSQELNDNRRVYRSKLLLDQDRAVRSTSLASIYRDAGMTEVSVREAASAVSYDYANYSAHLFLANSYDALRDPTRFNLRYETVWFNELLLANLLSPAGVGAISPNISQQEYFRLFERDRLGLTTTTELRSDGQYRQVASQFGTYGRLSYSLDLDWQRNEGVRPNNELTRIEWYSQIKLQLSPQDALFVLTKYQDYHSGDNFQYFDPTAGVRTNFNFDEFQTPIVVGAYHREWAPGVHTLLLGGRLINDQRLSDTPVPLLVVATNLNNQTLARSSLFGVNYRSELEIYTAELNQIVEHSRNTAVVGARYQTGEFDTRSSQVSLSLPAFFPHSNTVAASDFHHFAAYAYDTFEVIDHLRLTAGVAYDDLRFPRNYRQVPISEGEETRSSVSPKAALVWNPRPEATVRGVYARSLGGVNLDESYRLEPVQLAGFSQAFRTVIPESVAGSVSAPTFETVGAAVDLKLKSRTYIGLQGERLKSGVDRSWGVYDFNQGSTASVIPQRLNFEEHSVSLAVNQLVGEDWSFGAQYRFARDELRTRWTSLAPAVNPGFNDDQTSDLHLLGLYVLFNHPSGFFARAEANWYLQDNFLRTINPSGQALNVHLPGDEFWQFNFWVGYRLRRSRGDISMGLLNASGTDYRLNPLNPYAELPRERVVAGRLRLRF